MPSWDTCQDGESSYTSGSQMSLPSADSWSVSPSFSYHLPSLFLTPHPAGERNAFPPAKKGNAALTAPTAALDLRSTWWNSWYLKLQCLTVSRQNSSPKCSSLGDRPSAGEARWRIHTPQPYTVLYVKGSAVLPFQWRPYCFLTHQTTPAVGYSKAGDKRQERDGRTRWREGVRHTGQQGSCPLYATISFKRRKFK